MHVTDVRNVIIWGNHSSTQYPDVNHGTIRRQPIREVLADSAEWLNSEFISTVQQRGAAIIKVWATAAAAECCCCCCSAPSCCPAWLRAVQHSSDALLPAAHDAPLLLCCATPRRTAHTPQARGLSSAMSAASSACDHVRDWVCGTPEGTWVSMGVFSDGSYGQPEGVIFSFPVTCKAGKWSIVQVRCASADVLMRQGCCAGPPAVLLGRVRARTRWHPAVADAPCAAAAVFPCVRARACPLTTSLPPSSRRRLQSSRRSGSWRCSASARQRDARACVERCMTFAGRHC